MSEQASSGFRPDGDMPTLRIEYENDAVLETFHVQTKPSTDRKFRILRVLPTERRKDGRYETNVIIMIEQRYTEPDDSYDGVKAIELRPQIGSYPILAITDKPHDQEANLEIWWEKDDPALHEVIPRIKWSLLEAVDNEYKEQTGGLRFANPVSTQLTRAHSVVLHLPSAPETVLITLSSVLQLQSEVPIRAVSFIQ